MKTIIEMAKECGVHEYGPLTRNWSFELSQLERFAALVAAEVGIEQHKRGYDAGLRDGEEATKEKAAKLIDSLYKHDRKESGYDEGWNDALDIAEQAIRSMK